MKISEIKLMGIEEIQTKILDARKEYMTLRFQLVGGQLTDTSKLKQMKRSIAQYETILREKQLKINVEGEA